MHTRSTKTPNNWSEHDELDSPNAVNRCRTTLIVRTIAQNSDVLPSSHPGSEAASQPSFGKLLLLTLVCLTIVPDFRRIEGDDNPFVMIMGIANVLLGTWYCVLYHHFTTRLFLWVSTFVLLIGVGIITGILYGQETYFVLSHTIPVLSFMFAAIAGHSLHGDAEKKAAIGIILAVGLVAAAVKFVVGFYYYDLDIENVRYQIIAGSIPLLFAYGFAGMFSKGRKLALLSISIALFIVALSVTRAYIIVFGISALVCIYSYSRTASRLSGTLVLVIATSILAVTLTELFPGVLGRWTYRMTNSGFDVDLTAAFRVAEAEFQLRRLWSDGEGLLFGFGHAAKTGLAGDNVRLIAGELGREATNFSSFGYGHNLYVGLLYVGGLVGGVPVVVAFFQLLWKGLRHARQASASPTDKFLLIWGVSAFAGYLVAGMLAGTFGDRSISFFFGVSAGLVLLGVEPGRQVVNRVSHRSADIQGDARTPRERRAAMARQAVG
jgi:hypothetical protein